MNLVPNPEILLLQFMPFLAALFLLKFLILDPLVEYLKARADHIQGHQEQVANVLADSEKARMDYEAKTAAMRSEASAIRTAELKGAAEREKEILAAARASIETQTATFHERLQSEMLQVRAELTAQAEGLAGDVATRVLGRPVR